MSVTAITITIILIIFGSIAILFIGQARERARIEKIRKVNALQDRYRRMQRLINDIPPQYLNKELQIMIIETGLQTLMELTRYDATPRENKIAADQQRLKEVKESKAPPVAKPITDEASAKEVSKLLELLFRFIERQRASKKLDQTTSKKYLVYINYLISKSKADYFVFRAKDSFKSGKLRVAIHNYHNAISEMARIKDNPLALKAVEGYRLKIKELEAAAKQDVKQGPEEKTAADKEPLNKEWDSYLDKDDPWKKKNAYDD